MHDDTPEGFLLAKAARVCEAGIRRRSLPTNRNQLRQHLAHIRAELRNRRDPLPGCARTSLTSALITTRPISSPALPPS
jgi:hypothetical protein